MLNKLRKPVLILVDLVLVASSFYLALLLRHDWIISSQIKSAYLSLLPAVVIIRLTTFYMFGLYQWTFRFASMEEMVNVWKAVTLGSLGITVAQYMMQCGFLGRSVPIIDYILCFFLISASRFLPRVIIRYHEQRRASKRYLKRAIIIGADSAGEMVARELLKERIEYKPVGFIDNDPVKKNLKIHGLKVLGNLDKIETIVKKYNIEEAIIALPSSGKIIRDIILQCQALDIKFKIIPELHKILSGDIGLKLIRDVQPEDLLGREPVSINIDEVKSIIYKKTGLITGAGGTIGSELCRQLAEFGPSKLIINDVNENDIYFLELELKKKFPDIQLVPIIGNIGNSVTLKHIFTYSPQIIFHSAAYKHVPLMEQNIYAAVRNNILETRNLVYAASHYKTERFVYISTDKAVNPTSIMGVTKRVGEMLIQAKSNDSITKFMAVRFGNVIGSSGSVVPIFKKQIEDGGPVTVTHPEVRRYFMTVTEAVKLVLQAAAMGNGGEIFVLDMGEQIKILDLARNLIVLSGLKPDKDIPIVFTGLRPGEKLYEEILHDAENATVTKHNKIFITQSNDFIDPAQLRKDIRVLENLVKLMAEEKIIEKLKEMVPNYTPLINKK